MVKDEDIHPEKIEKLIEGYLFSEKEPMRDERLDLLNTVKLSVLKRKPITEHLLKRIVGFVDTFVNGMVDKKYFTFKCSFVNTMPLI